MNKIVKALFGLSVSALLASCGCSPAQMLVSSSPSSEQSGGTSSDSSQSTSSDTSQSSYQPGVYTLTFDSKGGSAVITQAIEAGGKFTRPTDPTKEGYDFAGWYKEDTYQNAFDFNAEVTANVTIYAKWNAKAVPSVEYTITFDSKGGTAVATQTIEAGEKFSIPKEPTKENYKFVGWYKEEACENEFEFNAEVTANVTVYAKWTPILAKYTITFDSKGGSSVQSQEIEEGSKFTKPADPTKEDYKFGGWYLDEEFNNAFDFTADVTADVTVYAKWTAVVYSYGIGHSGDEWAADIEMEAAPENELPEGYSAGYFYEGKFGAEEFGVRVKADGKQITFLGKDAEFFTEDGKIPSEILEVSGDNLKFKTAGVYAVAVLVKKDNGVTNYYLYVLLEPTSYEMKLGTDKPVKLTEASYDPEGNVQYEAHKVEIAANTPLTFLKDEEPYAYDVKESVKQGIIENGIILQEGTYDIYITIGDTKGAIHIEKLAEEDPSVTYSYSINGGKPVALARNEEKPTELEYMVKGLALSAGDTISFTKNDEAYAPVVKGEEGALDEQGKIAADGIYDIYLDVTEDSKDQGLWIEARKVYDLVLRYGQLNTDWVDLPMTRLDKAKYPEGYDQADAVYYLEHDFAKFDNFGIALMKGAVQKGWLNPEKFSSVGTDGCAVSTEDSENFYFTEAGTFKIIVSVYEAEEGTVYCIDFHGQEAVEHVLDIFVDDKPQEVDPEEDPGNNKAVYKIDLEKDAVLSFEMDDKPIQIHIVDGEEEPVDSLTAVNPGTYYIYWNSNDEIWVKVPASESAEYSYYLKNGGDWNTPIALEESKEPLDGYDALYGFKGNLGAVEFGIEVQADDAFETWLASGRQFLNPQTGDISDTNELVEVVQNNNLKLKAEGYYAIGVAVKVVDGERNYYLIVMEVEDPFEPYDIEKLGITVNEVKVADLESCPDPKYRQQAKGIIATAEEGNVLVFSYDGETIPNALITPNADPNNNLVFENDTFKLRAGGTNLEIYFQVIDNNEFTVWVSGYKTPTPAEKVDLWVRGTAVGGWETTDKNQFVVSDNANNFGELTNVHLGLGEFKLGNEDYSTEYNWYNYKSGGTNFAKVDGEGSDIRVLVPGVYNIYAQNQANGSGLYIVLVEADEKISITYESNGGSAVASEEIYPTQSFKEPGKPKRLGYEFKGWFLDDGTFKEKFDFSEPQDKGVTVYAKWDVITYTISYELGEGGVNAQGNPDSYNIESEEIELADPTKENHRFVGWYSDEDRTAPVEGVITTGSTGNKVFYAKFVDASLKTVTFVTGEGASLVAEGTAENGTPFVRPQNNPTREGYTFVNWYEKVGEEYAQNPYDFSTSASADLTLYAKWNIIAYNVTYHLGDGEVNGQGNPPTYTIEDQDHVLSPASKDGSTFVDWFLDEACTQAIAKIDSGSTGDLDLYPLWQTPTQLYVRGTATDAYWGDVQEGLRLYTLSNKTDIGIIRGVTLYKGDFRMCDSEWHNNFNYGNFGEYEGRDTYFAAAQDGDNNIRCKVSGIYDIYINSSNEIYIFFVEAVEDRPVVYTYGIHHGNGGNWTTSDNMSPVELTPAEQATLDTKCEIDIALESSEEFVVKLTNGSEGWYKYSSIGNDESKAFVNNHNDNIVAKTADTYHIVVTHAKNGDVKIYISLVKNVVTLNIDGNTDTTIELSVGESLAQPDDPAPKTGYTFVGWFEVSEGGEAIVFPLAVNADKTIYARYAANQYRVAFHGNDGAGEMADLDFTYDGEMHLLPENAFTRTGYRFVGWNTSADGSGTVYSADAFFTVVEGSPLTLYAQWVAKQYTIAFNGKGGSGSMEPIVNVSYDESVSLTANGFEAPAGKHFAGWDTDESGTNIVYANGAQVSNLSSADGVTITLYAVWLDKITLAFDSQGGSVVESQQRDPGEYYVKPDNPTREGYTFGGWYKEAGCQNEFKFDEETADESLTIYAKWTAKKYALTYDLNGGSGSIAGKDVTFADNYGALAVPEAANAPVGYHFVGWFIGDDEITSETIVATAANHSLTAHWAANAYAIVFNANGGTGTMSNKDMKYGTASNLPACTFTREFYKFAGWALSSDGAVVHGNEASVNNLTTEATITLYAKWEKSAYSYKINDGEPVALNEAEELVQWQIENVHLEENDTLSFLEDSSNYDFEIGSGSEGYFDVNGRIVTTGSYNLYLKISEGKLYVTKNSVDFALNKLVATLGGNSLTFTEKDKETYEFQAEAKRIVGAKDAEFSFVYDGNPLAVVPSEGAANLAIVSEEKLVLKQDAFIDIYFKIVEDNGVFAYEIWVGENTAYYGEVNSNPIALTDIKEQQTTDNAVYKIALKKDEVLKLYKGNVLLEFPALSSTQFTASKNGIYKFYVNSEDEVYVDPNIVDGIGMYVRGTVLGGEGDYGWSSEALGESNALQPSAEEGIRGEVIINLPATKAFKVADSNWSDGNNLGYSALEDVADDAYDDFVESDGNIGVKAENAGGLYRIVLTDSGKLRIYRVNYSLSFNSNGGSAVAAQSAHAGREKFHEPSDPTKSGATFGGWYSDPELETEFDFDAAVAANATAYAKWTYTITWNNDGGTLLRQDVVKEGATPSYGSNPTKAATAEYTYSFEAWSPAVVAAVANATYTATYTSVKNAYTVTWVNYDDSVLETDEDVLYGADPEYNGDTPTKAPTGQYTFAFNGWDKEITPVTGDITYKATYSPTTRTYLVRFMDGETVLQQGQVEYGTMPACNDPTKEGMNFNGWDPEIVIVTGEATYTAQFSDKASFTMTWLDDNGGPLKQNTCIEGGTPSYGAADPTKESTVSHYYTFEGWSFEKNGTPLDFGELDPVDEAMTFYAVFTPHLRSYAVTWVLNNGSDNVVDSIQYGSVPSRADPSKAQDDGYEYAFDGWESSSHVKYAKGAALPAVSGAETYTAVYIATARTYSLSLKVDGDAYDGMTSYTYDAEDPIVLPTPEKTNYTFDGWYTKSDYTGAKVTSLAAGTYEDQSLFGRFVANFVYGVVINEITYGLIYDEVKHEYALENAIDLTGLQVLSFITPDGAIPNEYITPDASDLVNINNVTKSNGDLVVHNDTHDNIYFKVHGENDYGLWVGGYADESRKIDFTGLRTDISLIDDRSNNQFKYTYVPLTAGETFTIYSSFEGVRNQSIEPSSFGGSSDEYIIKDNNGVYTAQKTFILAIYSKTNANTVYMADVTNATLTVSNAPTGDYTIFAYAWDNENEVSSFPGVQLVYDEYTHNYYGDVQKNTWESIIFSDSAMKTQDMSFNGLDYSYATIVSNLSLPSSLKYHGQGETSEWSDHDMTDYVFGDGLGFRISVSFIGGTGFGFKIDGTWYAKSKSENIGDAFDKWLSTSSTDGQYENFYGQSNKELMICLRPIDKTVKFIWIADI